MNVPKNLKYTKTHEWVEFLDEKTALVGITDFAQHGLGDIVFINLPKPGDAAVKDSALADVESVKAVSDVMSPFSGSVAEVNESAADNPQNLNTDPYGTWLVKIADIADACELLGAADYEAFCEEER